MYPEGGGAVFSLFAICILRLLKSNRRHGDGRIQGRGRDIRALRIRSCFGGSEVRWVTGESTDLPAVSVYQVRDGKIVESQMFQDTSAILDFLGNTK